MVKDKRTARAGALTAQDWIDAAGRAIVEGGIAAVAVEPLALRLGVTKGSFYWHFPNRAALLQAALDRWEKENTEAVIAEVDRIPDPRQRLERLLVEAFTDPAEADGAAALEFVLSHAFDLAVADAADDPIVQPIFRRVSDRRVEYVEECYRSLGLAPEAARHRALLAYAAYVGTLRLAREALSHMPRGEEYGAYQRHLIATLIPDDLTGLMEGSQPLPSRSEAHE